MTKSVARIVTRLQGSDDGFMVGTLLNGGEEVLKPNTVYELQTCFISGNLILKEVGESVVGCGITGYNWAFEQHTLLKRLSPYIFLSLKEYKEVMKVESNVIGKERDK